MAKQIDFKEYTRIRDIVQKRIKRASKAGLAPMVHVPTVKEIKAGLVSPSEAMRALKGFYSGGSQVKTIRQTGLVPEFKSFPSLPEEKPLSKAEKKQKQRDYQRDYRRRRKVRETAITPEKGKKYESYLKALESVSRTWKRAGKDIGIDLRSLSPSQAQAFVEYMDYRFSQGDFTQRYVIDEFIQDFSKLVSKGHSAKNIVNDFNFFLENRMQLQGRMDNMEGIPSWEFTGLWDDFIGS